MSDIFKDQISLFDFIDYVDEKGGGVRQQLTIDKPIRLIELFAG